MHVTISPFSSSGRPHTQRNMCGQFEHGVFFPVSTAFLQFELFASRYYCFPFLRFLCLLFLLVALSEISFGPGFDVRATSLHCPVANVSDVSIVSAPTAIVQCVHVRRAKSS